jgi:uracil-DNA glycosylase
VFCNGYATMAMPKKPLRPGLISVSVPSWRQLEETITQCDACPRLREHCLTIARVKRRQFIDEVYWGKPVTGFGDKKARLWIVGLAPAAHGANRTGRMFTGDSSGDWLYRALFETGFASQAESTSSNDGLVLKDTFISSSGRCAPPDNKPTPEELQNCFPFLKNEFHLLKKKRVILALGQIAHKQVIRLLREEMDWKEKSFPFSHGMFQSVEGLSLMTSYHPSRQNTQTGRLTRKMWNDIFKKVREIVG